MKRTVLAIDIGSTKVCALIAEIDDDNNAQIIGAGIAKAQGLRKGSITNIELASKSIKSALNDAKRVAGTELRSAIVTISGAYTKSLNSSGIVNIPNKEITLNEIQRVMHTSLYNANIPNEFEVLHALPYNFKVDDQDFIEDPLGMNAARLEVETHIITTQKSNLNNLRKAVKAAGVDVESVVLSGYASAIAVLNSDEKELGAAVVDMGGNTSNIVIHSGHAIRYNDFLGVGSNHITNDLSMALHTPLHTADNVKINYGSLYAPSNDLIELPVIGDETSTHEVSLEVVHNVIYARVEETLMIIAQSIEKSGLKEHMGAGVVLTGGFTKIEGLRELAVAILDNMPVRLAKPTDVGGLFDTLRDPSYSGAVGLIKYLADGYTPYEIDVNRRMRHASEDSAAVHGGTLPEEAPKFDPLTPSASTPTPAASTPPAKEEKIAETAKMVNIGSNKSVQNDQPNPLSKFWNWATQLF
ncbi:MAG: cell division protein FtsA [Sulfuricurvum sp. GWF2_44_89]|uniref:Cell division protein FtsA n=1 Tax=Sulfuricurvum kujiense TaxID=148813 RepID=A0A2D3WET7_9BACT|nr:MULTISPECIES: cell division protein FtsA [Sulfuricurvum]OHD77557.1 MAG: cell division protein FtsA [Sulfuricurvum sp. GWF2_44_89]OHD92244.1 MAG: cell division protein FtsA [Sulfuricurvum sp. RIFOXYD2_FULL_44_160]OHD96352.1 MAG: cell division protein FtsA [Sulfuricurvum sp. RIFOXYD12_FULL_44_77]DAB38415.1 MAG TPA: cell division protein FtsA [Sulfuricurvum kujiense]